MVASWSTAYWASLPRKAGRSRVVSERKTRPARAKTYAVVRVSMGAPRENSSGAMKRRGAEHAAHVVAVGPVVVAVEVDDREPAVLEVVEEGAVVEVAFDPAGRVQPGVEVVERIQSGEDLRHREGAEALVGAGRVVAVGAEVFAVAPVVDQERAGR